MCLALSLTGAQKNATDLALGNGFSSSGGIVWEDSLLRPWAWEITSVTIIDWRHIFVSYWLNCGAGIRKQIWGQEGPRTCSSRVCKLSGLVYKYVSLLCKLTYIQSSSLYFPLCLFLSADAWKYQRSVAVYILWPCACGVLGIYHSNAFLATSWF